MFATQDIFVLMSTVVYLYKPVYKNDTYFGQILAKVTIKCDSLSFPTVFHLTCYIFISTQQ